MNKNLEKLADLIGNAIGNYLCEIVLKESHGTVLNFIVKKPELHLKLTNNNGELVIENNTGLINFNTSQLSVDISNIEEILDNIKTQYDVIKNNQTIKQSRELQNLTIYQDRIVRK